MDPFIKIFAEALHDVLIRNFLCMHPLLPKCSGEEIQEIILLGGHIYSICDPEVTPL